MARQPGGHALHQKHARTAAARHTLLRTAAQAAQDARNALQWAEGRPDEPLPATSLPDDVAALIATGEAAAPRIPPRTP